MRKLIIPFLLCLFGAMFYSYEFVLRLMPGTIAGHLTEKYSINAQQLGLLSAFYYYAYNVMQIPVGILFDRYRPYLLIVFASLCCLVGTVLFVSTDYLWVAKIGRFLVGFGSAFAFIGALKIAAMVLPSNLFPIASGIVSAFGMFGAMLGALILNHLMSFFSWSTVVYIFAVIAIPFIFIALILHFHKGFSQKVYADRPQVSLREIIISLYQSCLQWKVWMIGVIGAILFLPISVFVMLWGMPYLMDSYSLSRGSASFAVSCLLFGATVGCPFLGWLASRFKLRKSLIVSSATGIAILFAILLGTNVALTAFLYPLLFLVGIGVSSVIILFVIVKEQVDLSYAAVSIALVNMMVMLGGMLLQPAAGNILDNYCQIQVITHQTINCSITAYRMSLMMIPIAAAFAACLSCLLPKLKSGER